MVIVCASYTRVRASETKVDIDISRSSPRRYRVCSSDCLIGKTFGGGGETTKKKKYERGEDRTAI